MVVVNGKYLSQKVTGVQRYAHEIVSQWQDSGREFSILKPQGKLPGLWEQTLQPGTGNMLWCPTNTGPVLPYEKVVTLHDCAVFYNPDWFSATYRLWRKAVIPCLARRSRAIITVSEFSKSVITDLVGVSAEKVHVIPNGVNTEFFSPVECDKNLLSRYGVDRPYLLTVGSLDPRKNIKSTLQAWARLPGSVRENCRLVIVGGAFGSFRKESLDIPPGVIFTGYVPDEVLPALYSSARGFVYPSLFEGFGLPVLEAMACGTPVLTANTTALPEVAGEHARLVDPLDLDAISGGMIAMLEQPSSESLSKLLIAHARSYSWNTSADKTWNVLQGVIN